MTYFLFFCWLAQSARVFHGRENAQRSLVEPSVFLGDTGSGGQRTGPDWDTVGEHMSDVVCCVCSSRCTGCFEIKHVRPRNVNQAYGAFPILTCSVKQNAEQIAKRTC